VPDRNPTEALTFGGTALAAHDQVLGRDHAWTNDSARVTADALDALGRTEEAKALRERYGVASPDEPLSGWALYSRKLNNNAPFHDFLKSGWPIFFGNREGKEAHSTRIPCRVCCFKRPS